MPRFFFDLSHNGEVYHDARGTSLKSPLEAQDRAFEIVRRFATAPAAHGDSGDLMCTIRDAGGHELMKVVSVSGTPVIIDPGLSS
ncbi:DUF6894 family protein [Mesorhizobium captivum]|uniref:DUF6894 family protein n=1 Tax=Mesorhizobium captivum TaxID=3072319 RepID=UPI003D3238AD